MTIGYGWKAIGSSARSDIVLSCGLQLYEELHNNSLLAMKLGMNLLLWTTGLDKRHFVLLEDLQRAGLDGVEVMVDPSGPDNYETVRGRLGDLGLEATTITALHREADPVSPDAEVRERAVEHLKWAVDASARMGSRLLCGPFHSAHGNFSGSPPTIDELSRASEVLFAAAEYAATCEITLALESLNRFECYLVTNIQQAVELVDRVGHPSLGLLYDTHHAHIEEKDVEAAILAGGSHIRHVHLSENDRGVPGTGQVDWDSTFRALRSIQYDGWLVIEAFSRLNRDFASAVHVWRDFFPSDEQVYREGSRFVRRLWGESASTR